MKPGLKYVLQILLLSMLGLGTFQLSAVDFENDPVINSNEILDSNYLSSTYHRVENIGFQNGYYIFNIESDYGRDEILSIPLAKKRIDEIKILSEAINQFASQNQNLSRELRSQFEVRGESAVDILANPFSTASEMASQLRENLGDTLTGKSPFTDKYAIEYSYSEPTDPTTAQHKRNVAYQLQLDLYSRNYRVQSFLNSIANARSAGRVSAGVNIGQSFFNTSRQSAIDQQIRIILKNKSLDALNQYHKELLQELGANSLLADAFVKQPFLSPTNRTVILLYLKQIKHVEGIDKLLELITTSDNPVTSLDFERLCRALYFYHSRESKFERYINFNAKPAVISPDNSITIFEHKDLIIWNELNIDKFQSLTDLIKKENFKEWQIISLGAFTDTTVRKLNEFNFSIKQDYLNNN